MDQFFTDLGRRVRARWKAENFALARFPEIATQALEEQPPAEHVDLAALMQEFLLDDDQPFQTTSGFGEPELVVYDDPRFYIQLLFWLEGTTDIHQHTFSGAFHVLAGSSIHSRFVFENTVPVSAHLRVGDLRMTETRLLETGSTVPIISGTGYIHALFHLEMPSVTVVVRTHTDPGTGPQFTYLPPHLAVDPFHNDTLTTRRKQLLDVLEKTEDPAYADVVREMVGALDFERGFFILQNGLGHLRRLGRWEEALEVFAAKHGALAAGVAPTLEELVRRDGIAALRSAVTEAEHRFFLALLLNVPKRADLLAMVAQRFPGPPTATVLRWAEELGAEAEFSGWLLDAEFAPDLPLDAPLAALRYFLEGGKSPCPAEELAALREAFRGSSWRALVE